MYIYNDIIYLSHQNSKIDLEFVKQYNPHLTPTITETMLDQLFTELVREFHTAYQIMGPINKTQLVDLDSSTDIKFSRHWILHLHNDALFTNARNVGAFVRRFVNRLEKECKGGELKSRGHEFLADNLLVYAEDDDVDDDDDDDEGKKKKKMRRKTHFIDLGVYTRNRIFRLLGSTKFGKPSIAALRIADANQFPFPCGFDNAKFYIPDMMMNTTPTSTTDVGVNNNDAKNVRDNDDDDDDVTTVDVSSYTKLTVLSLLYICHATNLSANKIKCTRYFLEDPGEC